MCFITNSVQRSREMSLFIAISKDQCNYICSTNSGHYSNTYTVKPQLQFTSALNKCIYLLTLSKKQNKTLFFPFSPLHTLIISIFKQDVVQPLQLSQKITQCNWICSETSEVWLQEWNQNTRSLSLGDLDVVKTFISGEGEEFPDLE